MFMVIPSSKYEKTILSYVVPISLPKLFDHKIASKIYRNYNVFFLSKRVSQNSTRILTRRSEMGYTEAKGRGQPQPSHPPPWIMA